MWPVPPPTETAARNDAGNAAFPVMVRARQVAVPTLLVLQLSVVLLGGGPAGPHSAGGAVVSGAVGGDTAAEI